MGGKYTVLVAGSEVDLWESIDFDNSLDLTVNKAQIQFPDSSDLLSAEGVGKDVIIQRDGVNIWRGLGISNQKIYDSNGKKQYNLNCLSNKIYLQREIFQKGGSYVATYGGAQNGTSSMAQPPFTSATSIFADILNSQTSTNLTAGTVGSSNIPHAALIITRQTAIQVLSQLIAASLWEARFNYDNTVDYGSNSDGTIGSKTSVYTVQADENAMKTEVDYGIDKLVNQVIICGAGSQAGQLINQLKVQNTPSITAFGAWSKIINLPNCADPNLLQAYANALLNDLGGNIYTVNAKLADLSTGVSFKMGDYVSVNNPSFNLNNALFRVVSEKRHYDAQQAEDVNVVLAQNYRMVNVTHFKLKRLEDILNSQLQNQQIFNNNFSQTPSQLPLQITDSQGANIGVGKFQSFSAYLVISVSGINAGFTPNFVPSGQSGIAVTASNALDTYTNTNYSCGTFYSADVYDHIFKITGTVYNGGASQYTGTVSLTVTLTQPTIPQ